MTEHEKIVKLAMGVMEWVAETLENCDGVAFLQVVDGFQHPQWTGYGIGLPSNFQGTARWRDGESTYSVMLPGENWNPFTRWDHAGMVLEKMEELGFDYTICGNHDREHGGPIDGYVEFWMGHKLVNYRCAHFRNASDIPAAIGEAALATLAGPVRKKIHTSHR